MNAPLTKPSESRQPAPSQYSFFKPWTPWLYLAFPLVLLNLFFLAPMLMALQISMLDYGHNIAEPDFIWVQNYVTLFTSPHFWKVLGNTVLFMILVVPLMVLVPIPVAVLMNQQLKGITVFRAIIYIPVVISLVVASLAWKWMYAPNGIINYLLSLVGIPQVGWLINEDIALLAVSLMVVWKGVGYYMMMYLANLQSVSSEVYEAADVDGAGLLRKHWYVTMPHLRPAMAMVTIISTIGALKVFTEIYVMTRGGPIGSTETFVYYIYDQAFANLNLGIASAAGFVLMLIIFGLSLLHIRFFYLKAEKEAFHA